MIFDLGSALWEKGSDQQFCGVAASFACFEKNTPNELKITMNTVRSKVHHDDDDIKP